MTKKEVLISRIETLPELLIEEVLDFVQFLETKKMKGVETYLLSESSLKKDWLRPEEEEAWKDL